MSYYLARKKLLRQIRRMGRNEMICQFVLYKCLNSLMPPFDEVACIKILAGEWACNVYLRIHQAKYFLLVAGKVLDKQEKSSNSGPIMYCFAFPCLSTLTYCIGPGLRLCLLFLSLIPYHIKQDVMLSITLATKTHVTPTFPFAPT